MGKRAAVIIPNYGPEENLVRCLESLGHCRNFSLIRTVVVHSGPWPLESPFELPGLDSVIIRSEDRLFPGAARNLGAATVGECDLLIFLDSDCVVDPGWIDGHIEAHAKNTGAVAGRVLPAPQGKPSGLAEYLIEFAVTRCLPPSGEFMSLPACNFSMRGELFRKLGGFPDDPAGQDLHFNLMLRSFGERISFSKSAIVYHYCRADPREFRENRRRIGRGLGSVTFQAEKEGMLDGGVSAEYRFLRWICRSPFGILLTPAKLFRLFYLIVSGDFSVLIYLLSCPFSLIRGLWIEGRHCRMGYLEELMKADE